MNREGVDGVIAHELVLLEGHAETAHMFIVSPLLNGSFLTLVGSHSQVEKRIAQLRVLTY